MPLPSNVGFGIVKGRFIDSTGQAIQGDVTFTPSPAKLLNTSAAPGPVTILPRPVVATLDLDGAFTQNLIATNDVDNNPIAWTYTVSFKFIGAQLAAFPIDVPQNTTVDLTDVTPLSSSNGALIVRGPGVATGGEPGQILLKSSFADYDTVWGDAPDSGGTGGGLDAEEVRDTIAATIVGAGLVTVTANDALDRITVSTTATANETDANLKARGNHTGTQSLDTTTDSATRLALTANERTKLTSVASGATVNSTDAYLRDRANHTGSQVASTVSDFTEAVEDAVAALMGRSTHTGLTWTYSDVSGTLAATVTGGGGGDTDPEIVRDTIAAALLGTGLITVTVNDPGDSITISTTATANSNDAFLRDRVNHTGLQTSATVSDFAEAVEDAVAALMNRSTHAGISYAYNDAAGTLSSTVSGGGGGLQFTDNNDGTGDLLAGGGTSSVVDNNDGTATVTA